MTNPVDETDSDTETLPDEPAEKLSDETDETLVDETLAITEEKIPKKKVALLKARHTLEEYFENKKLKEALDYLSQD